MLDERHFACDSPDVLARVSGPPNKVHLLLTTAERNSDGLVKGIACRLQALFCAAMLCESLADLVHARRVQLLANCCLHCIPTKQT